MYIKYSLEGLHESFSNSQRKSMDVFMRDRQFYITESPNTPFITSMNISAHNKVECYFDVKSLSHMVNMDCYSCASLYPDMKCTELYPLEIVLDVDECFSIFRVVVFVNCEDVRLVSYYGKRGHLRHCVDSNLFGNPYYKSDCDKCNKEKHFVSEKYDYAYLALKNKILELFGVKLYDNLCIYADEYIKSLSKFGKLF